MLKTVAAVSMLLGLTFSGVAAAAPVQASTPVQSFKIVPAGFVFVYNSGMHGPRCRYRGPHCGYYYGGWWYAQPYWRAGPVVVAPPPGYWVYNPYRHGPRCRYRGPRCGYFYHGWWYGRPFWTLRIN